VGAREWDGPQAQQLIRTTFNLGQTAPVLLKK
jgi:hypothetical protein